MLICAIFDKVAGKSSSLELCVNKGVATRMFNNYLEKCTPGSKDDFVLYYFGEYDFDTCAFSLLDKPEVIGGDLNGKTVRERLS